MKRFVCCPAEKVPENIPTDTEYLILYASSNLISSYRGKPIGHLGISLPNKLRDYDIAASVLEWDFVTIALSVAAVDNSYPRDETADGWTRCINVTIHLNAPELWNTQQANLEELFHFLTGDYWFFEFLPEGVLPPQLSRRKNRKVYDEECVSLLSGGLDSLIGALDLFANHRKTLLVSQITKCDKSTQEEIADALGAQLIQLSFSKKAPRKTEHSTRGRSIVFFAYALLAASLLRRSSDQCIDIHVPENGFISLNVPLNAGRVGSLSTRTTHPIYMDKLQEIWDAVGLKAKLIRNYQFKTKGEMLIECRNPQLLHRLMGQTISCGKTYIRDRKHCGRCIPCLVRRAAFLRANIPDPTLRQYKFENLCGDAASKKTGENDFQAAAEACLYANQKGIKHFCGGELAFASPLQRRQYEAVVERGLAELETFLQGQRVL